MSHGRIVRYLGSCVAHRPTTHAAVALHAMPSLYLHLTRTSRYSVRLLDDPTVAVGKRKDKTRSCEKCRHLERGTHVPDGGIPQREEAEMVWTCAKAR